MRDAWFLSRFAGLFRAAGPAPRRAHDPDVAVWSGVPANRDAGAVIDGVGGAGWTEEAAELAAIGEAIERWQTHRLPGDAIVNARFGDRAIAGAIDPAAWVLFSAEQYALAGFGFAPLRDAGAIDWVKLRRIADGEPAWVPADLMFMDMRPGIPHRFTPGISTGWSAHRTVEHAVLRAVQEVIERDAAVGGWWGAYPIEAIAFDVPPALARPNLRYRAYRIDSPFSAHVTVVTVEGEDREGDCFSIGSACRETRAASLEKAALEAVQGRYYVRFLRRAIATGEHAASLPLTTRDPRALRSPRTFAEHAVAYSIEPARLAATPLARAKPEHRSDPRDPRASGSESLADLIRRLGDAHPPLFRLMTPPALTELALDWVVVRVMIPGLQPLHGDHLLPFLGGPHWGGRPLAAWSEIPPHPFA